MQLAFNKSVMKKVFYNGAEMKKVFYNGIQVFRNAPIYYWNKYFVGTTTTYSRAYQKTSKYEYASPQEVFYTSYSISNGKYVFSGETYASAVCYSIVYQSGGTSDTMKECYNGTSSWGSSGYSYEAEYYGIASSTKEVQGSYISAVSSENSSAYPANGKHTDGYWYVYDHVDQ